MLYRGYELQNHGIVQSYFQANPDDLPVWDGFMNSAEELNHLEEMGIEVPPPDKPRAVSGPSAPPVGAGVVRRAGGGSGSVSLTHRLNALERNHRPVTDVTEVTEETRRRIRELAEHNLRCRSGEEYGRHPLWEIDDDGIVYAAHDGKEITTTLQTAGELFYWMHVEWGYPECVHDEDEQAFYSRASGELVLSRDYFNLPAMGRARRGELQRRVGEG